MTKETIVIEGVLKSLEGLKSIMDTIDDTEASTELGDKIQAAIETATRVTDDDELETADIIQVDIDVSKEVAVKTISWADYGWHISFVGPDGVHYMWL
jgi:hypothetical protein